MNLEKKKKKKKKLICDYETKKWCWLLIKKICHSIYSFIHSFKKGKNMSFFILMKPRPFYLKKIYSHSYYTCQLEYVRVKEPDRDEVISVVTFFKRFPYKKYFYVLYI